MSHDTDTTDPSDRLLVDVSHAIQGAIGHVLADSGAEATPDNAAAVLASLMAFAARYARKIVRLDRKRFETMAGRAWAMAEKHQDHAVCGCPTEGLDG